MVIMGGLLIIAVYGIFALIIKLKGIQSINKIFPPVIVGGVTMVIGLNLAKFLINYCGQSRAIDASGTILDMSVINDPKVITGILIAIVTMIITAIVSHYGKGFMKNIPFLFGIAGGYILTIILQFSIPYFSTHPLISFEAFNKIQWYPDVPFIHPEYFVWD